MLVFKHCHEMHSSWALKARHECEIKSISMGRFPLLSKGELRNLEPFEKGKRGLGPPFKYPRFSHIPGYLTNCGCSVILPNAWSGVNSLAMWTRQTYRTSGTAPCTPIHSGTRVVCLKKKRMKTHRLRRMRRNSRKGILFAYTTIFFLSCDIWFTIHFA